MAGADRLIVRHKVSLIISLPASYQQTIDKIPGVAGSAHLTWFGGIYQDPKNFFPQMAVVPEEILAIYPKVILAPEQKKAWLNTRNGAVAGRNNRQAFRLEGRRQNTHHHRHLDQCRRQPALGISIWWASLTDEDKRPTPRPLWFRYDYFDEGRQYDKGHVGWYVIRVKDPSQAVGHRHSH